MIFKTCRTKQTVFYTLTAVLILGIFALGVYTQFSRQTYDALDTELIGAAKRLTASPLDPVNLAENETVIRKDGNAYYETGRRGGDVSKASLEQKSPLGPALAAAFNGEPSFESIKLGNAKYRALYYPAGKNTVLKVSRSMAEADKQVARLQHLFLLYFPVTIMVIYSISWLLAGKIIAPIIKMRTLTETVRQSRNVYWIEMVPTGREIDGLVKLVNEMLQSLHDTVEFQGRFSSDVSHEIRSPLTSLRGTIEVALRKTRTPEEYEEILRKNLSDIVRLSKISDNLLFLARADNNILELRKQSFGVNGVLHGIVQRMKYSAATSQISLIEDYSEGLQLFGDADLLEQAFTNLIDNAIKYTLKGGRVTVRTSKDPEGIKVSVSDTGIGIPDEEIPYVFDRFHRVSKERSRKLGGTGLGLAISRWIIDAHNAKITVESVINAGSDFTVTFPATA